jgi:hypothetical protein
VYDDGRRLTIREFRLRGIAGIKRPARNRRPGRSDAAGANDGVGRTQRRVRMDEHGPAPAKVHQFLMCPEQTATIMNQALPQTDTHAPCPKCGTIMSLVVVTPHPIAANMLRRTYLCTTCNQTKTYVRPVTDNPAFTK